MKFNLHLRTRFSLTIQCGISDNQTIIKRLSNDVDWFVVLIKPPSDRCVDLKNVCLRNGSYPLTVLLADTKLITIKGLQ